MLPGVTLQRTRNNPPMHIFADYDDGSITKNSLTGTSVTSTNDVSITSYERTCDIFRLQNGSTAAILGSAGLDDSISILSLQTMDGIGDLQRSIEQQIPVANGDLVIVNGVEEDDDGDEDDEETEKQLSS